MRQAPHPQPTSQFATVCSRLMHKWYIPLCIIHSMLCFTHCVVTCVLRIYIYIYTYTYTYTYTYIYIYILYANSIVYIYIYVYKCIYKITYVNLDLSFSLLRLQPGAWRPVEGPRMLSAIWNSVACFPSRRGTPERKPKRSFCHLCASDFCCDPRSNVSIAC